MKNPGITPSNINNSIETLKVSFATRLYAILHTELTVENIESFASDALNNLINLNNDILKSYRENENLNPLLDSSVRSQEDDAYEKFGLQNIQDILEEVIKINEKIIKIKSELFNKINDKNLVITPTIAVPIQQGEGGIQRVFLPRLLTLMYILSNDFGLEMDSVGIDRGIVTSEMFRKEPYFRITIPDLERVLYLCEENGNVTYVFDSQKIFENNLDIDEIDIDTKLDKNELIKRIPGIGIRIIQSSNWRSIISNVLENDIPSEDFSVTKIRKKVEFVFRTNREDWLPFDMFKQEIKDLYDGSNNIRLWFFKERKKHPNWSSNPNKEYKVDGWTGFADILGRVNLNKGGWLPFDMFKQEIKDSYSGHGDIQEWYKEERKKHPNWPSVPKNVYKDDWTGFHGVLGIENPLNKEWLPFDQLKEEVISLYPGQGSVAVWYHKERKKHPNWPSVPKNVYKDDWVDWSNLVNKENILKKTWPPFDMFKHEIVSLYPGSGDVQVWYHKERKKHPNWPSVPKYVYKDDWIGWPELFDIENRLKKEWLSFEELRREAMSLYPGIGKAQVWYYEERKKHPNWPSLPQRVYKDKGWRGFYYLVGNKN